MQHLYRYLQTYSDLFSSQYDIEMAQNIHFVMYLDDDPHKLFETMSQEGYKPLEEYPDVFYREDKSLDGKEVVRNRYLYIWDGKLVQVNLPAVRPARFSVPYIKTLIVSCLDKECPRAIDDDAPAQVTMFTSPIVEFNKPESKF